MASLAGLDERVRGRAHTALTRAHSARGVRPGVLAPKAGLPGARACSELAHQLLMAYPPCPPGAPDLGFRPHDKFGDGELGRRVMAARSGQVKIGPVRLPAAGLVAIEADFKVDKTQNRVGPVESGSQTLCSTPQIAAEVARLALAATRAGAAARVCGQERPHVLQLRGGR